MTTPDGRTYHRRQIKSRAELYAAHEQALRAELRRRDLTISRQAEQIASLRRQLIDAQRKTRQSPVT